MTIPVGWSTFTPVFKNCDQTAFTLEQITVCNMNGEELNDFEVGTTSSGKNLIEGVPGTGKCNNKIEVKKLKSGETMLVDTAWMYTSSFALFNGDKSLMANTWGWAKNRTQTISEGEGITVHNSLTYPVTFRVSGEVVLKPMKVIPVGYSVWGNNTPVAIKLEDIKVCNTDGVELNDFEIGTVSSGKNLIEGIPGTGKCNNKVEIKKLKQQETMVVGDAWMYTSSYALFNGDKTLMANTWGWNKNRAQTILPGEGVIVRNQLSYPVIFKLKNPLTGEYED